MGGKGGAWGFDPWAMMMSMMGGKGKGKWSDNAAKRAPPSKKVFVGGLPELGSAGLSKDLNKKLKEHFDKAGTCTYAEIGRKGTGTAVFKTEEEAKTAVTLLNGSVFDGNHVLVVSGWGKPKDEGASG